jgi:hypothetical protein
MITAIYLVFKYLMNFEFYMLETNYEPLFQAKVAD